MDTLSTDTLSARIGLIEFQAKKFGIPPALAVAIARVESDLNRFAIRHEPAYPYLWNVAKREPFPCSETAAGRRNPPPHFPAPAGSSRLTEWIGQQTSWGCMQVMGAVAREYGFQGHFGSLCDTMTGAEYGCRLLQRLASRHLARHGWLGVVSAYNDGDVNVENNRAYIEKVEKAGAREILRGKP